MRNKTNINGQQKETQESQAENENINKKKDRKRRPHHSNVKLQLMIKNNPDSNNNYTTDKKHISRKVAHN